MTSFSMRISGSTEPAYKNDREQSSRAGGKPGLFLILLVPIDCAVLTVLLVMELVGRLWRRVAPATRPEFPVPRSKCSFVLLSWNSQTMLAESLPALLNELREEEGDHEVIVLDNHSTDGTDEFIRRRFPEVRLISSAENVYFGAGNRLGIAAATRDILILMNSDIIVQPGFLPPLLQALSDPTVFGVASQFVCTGTACTETGNTHARIGENDIEWTQDPVTEQISEYPVFWLHRGLFAVDRRKYLWLGGLDSLYDPLYMEDVDVSYRAWKVGWKCLLAAQSRVLHHHQISTPAAGEGFLNMLVRRNQYIFFWKNINSLSMLTRYCFGSTSRRMRRANMKGIGILREMHSFLAALKRFPIVLVRRLSFGRRVTFSDRDVFAASGQVGHGCSSKETYSTAPDGHI